MKTKLKILKTLKILLLCMTGVCTPLLHTVPALAKETTPALQRVDQGTELPNRPESSTNAASTIAPDPTAHLYALGLGLGLSVGGSVTWKFYKSWTGRFNVINEGWFGTGTYAGGGDKLGHMYTDFVLGRGLFKIYQAHGYNKETSILYAFLAGSTARTVMEFADGFTTYEFSWGDLAFNMLGSSSNALLLSNDKLARTFYMSWSYVPSIEAQRGYHDIADFSTDYSGMVFGFNADVSELRRWNGPATDSSWDYTFVGLNYYTRNFRQPEYSKRERFVGASIGLTMERFLPDDGYDWAKPILHFVKLPFTYTGLAYSLDKGNIEAKWGLNYLY